MPALSDSSPLILLARVGRLQLMRDLFGEIVVTPAVRNEVVADGPGRPGEHEVSAASWISVVVPQRAPSEHGLPAHLGAGEAEVIALALELGGSPLIVLDDGPGRRVARHRGLDIVGTAGLLVLAKEAGLLPAVRPALDELLSAGLFLGEAAYRDVLAAAGEA